MRIGLFGGSFNPPHRGHLLVAEIAIRRLKLDQLWWMVTPGNPLKDQSALAPLEERLNQCAKLISSPKIKLTGFEASINSHYSADTIAHILRYNRGGHFVLVIGADNMVNMHRWYHWRRIITSLPIAIIDRPGKRLEALSSPMALAFQRARVPETDIDRLFHKSPPAWCYLHGPRSDLSSSILRRGGQTAN